MSVALHRPVLGGALLAACLTLSGCEILGLKKFTEPATGSPVVNTDATAQETSSTTTAATDTTSSPSSVDLASLPPAATPPASTLPVPATPPAIETASVTPPPAPPIEESEPIAATGLSMEIGVYRCELNRMLSIKQIAGDGQAMVMTWAGRDYNLTAVRARSGALRYEDATSGLTWITIVGKSLLLDLKNGQQLANECKYAPGAVAEPTPPPVPVKASSRSATARKKASR